MTPRALLPLGIAIVALAVAHPGVSSRAGSAVFGPCSESTVGGATIHTYCGPARATVTFGGKTHTFKGGRCGLTTGSLKGWALGIGKYTAPPAKPKFRYFGVAFVGTPKPGVFRKGEYIVTIHLAGKSYSVIGSPLGTPAMTTKVTKGAKKGTFSGRLNGTGGAPISGSWSC